MKIMKAPPFLKNKHRLRKIWTPSLFWRGEGGGGRGESSIYKGGSYNYEHVF